MPRGRTPGFNHPEHFTKGKRSQWSCNLCTPHPPRSKNMCIKHALAHEKWERHNRNVVNAKLPKQEEMTKDEARDLEHRYFFNHVGEYISYWSRGVEAGKSPKNTGRNKRQELGDRFKGSSYAFVEDIARQEEANAERRGQMHDFFEMPTDKKVQRINELIRSLQTMDDC